jgi:hypothetical protein
MTNIIMSSFATWSFEGVMNTQLGGGRKTMQLGGGRKIMQLGDQPEMFREEKDSSGAE